MTGAAAPNRLTESVHRIVRKADGEDVLYSWPSREDYIAWYRRTGQLDEGLAFDDAISLHSPTFLDWIRRNQTGCLFAAKLARNTGSKMSDWASVVIAPTTPSQIVSELMERILSEACASAEILQVIFPGVRDVNRLVEMINVLCKSDSWYWEEIPDETSDGILNVGLRWIYPDGRHVAWIVGFGDFDFVPFTRRAPLTTIIIRTQVDKRSPYSAGVDGRVPIHLADMDDLLGANNAARDELTQRTKALKQAYLGGELIGSARARVTFSLPSHARAELIPAGLSQA